jgi:hypothetical protein
MTLRVDDSERAVCERISNGPTRWRWPSQPCTDLSNLEDVATCEVFKRNATKKNVLPDVSRTHRVAFRAQGLQHLLAPQTQGPHWTSMMLHIALTIAQATVYPDRKERNHRFGHATFGSGVKRDDARFGDHWSHSA